MTTPNPNLNEQDPFIPAFYMLILAALGLLIAVVVALTQPVFSVVGWGGLGLAIVALVVWVFMAPEQAKSILTGRTARYGGTTVLVTILFLVALIAIYSVVKSRNIRVDLTQRDTFSLTDTTREAISSLSLEPNVPNIKILAFYETTEASQRDQAAILLDDYVKTSSNKIAYEFIDPVRVPGVVQQYDLQANSTGSISRFAVVPLDGEGNPVADKAETVQFLSQEEITNAIMRVAASGDFRAYFLTTADTAKLTDTTTSGLSDINSILQDVYNWKTQEVSILDLTSPQSTIQLNDPTADGEVLVIVGGMSALTDDQAKFITDYLDAGGKLIMYAAPLNEDGSPTLATSETLSTYLYNNFGMRFANDIVLDQFQAFDRLPFQPAALGSEMSASQYITQEFTTNPNYFAVFRLSRSIEFAPTFPTGVTVAQLVNSGGQSYAKTDPNVLTATEISQFDQVETDAKGPFVLAASAENASTGAKVVLIGSSDVPTNYFTPYSQQGIVNSGIALTSFYWTTNFEDFFTKIPQVAAQERPEDTPIVVAPEFGRTANFITLILLPFGILLIGIAVWWFSREKRTS
ncbi:MAG: GldG family protein [Chloroflexi bacterium]|nr:GldG family protein [Chloroflexota bacterium]